MSIKTISDDPDELALLLVQQYLSDHQMFAALQATEEAHGLKYVEEKLPRSSILLQLVYDQMEREAAEDVDQTEFDHQLEALLQGGASDYPCHLAACIGQQHTSAITAVVHCPDSSHVISGTGNGFVQCLSLDGTELWKQHLANGGAISLAVSPLDRQLLVGSMDGTVSILQRDSGEIQCQQKVHQKYVVKVLWAPDGQSFLTASWDGNAYVFSLPGLEGRLVQQKHVPFATAVQDVLLLPGNAEVMFALRGTNYLRMHKFPNIEEVILKINMNALQDDHISFSARQLALSPNQQFLLVSTDSPRILLLSTRGWELLPAHIFGLPMDKFHNSVACWDYSGYYVIAAASAGWIYIFHAGTAKVVHKFKAHDQNVRWLDYIPDQRALITCSFDCTVKLWKAI